ncbi:DNA repair endonuclease XPF [Lethenteron reissneri]|uniref:DNA repair endonuclease XPF n=1 Tax=Lethenteron reissneri TaxID=7753 RepID=UPI002AB7E554|nr:DNA repair endonuclease XPF [Lethenteron reissneri]
MEMGALLEHERQMAQEVMAEDGLVVTARGMGADRLLLHLIALHCEPGALLVVINTSPAEEEHFIEELRRAGVSHLPRVITNEVSGPERQDVYLQGGAFFITSRILVVDFLTDRIPAHLITGILVYKAHRLIESCQEAFVLRLFRQKNKTGFIKAFSDQPVAFSAGFCRVERVMRSLFVRKLYLWPRFHAVVQASLERHRADVVELHVCATAPMRAVQAAALELLDACLKELRRSNPALESAELTLENAVSGAFDKTVRLQLDPVWHTLSWRTRALVQDLKLLRTLLLYLTQYDAVTFLGLLESLRSSQKAFGQNSGWLFLDAANSLFVHARARVYGYGDADGKTTGKEKAPPAAGKRKEERKAPTVERNPKWDALMEVLGEIERDADSCTELGPPGPVLICASDHRTCAQLQELLRVGPDALLRRLLSRAPGRGDPSAAAAAAGAAPPPSPPPQPLRGRGGGEGRRGWRGAGRRGGGKRARGGTGAAAAEDGAPDGGPARKKGRGDAREALTLTQMLGGDEAQHEGRAPGADDGGDHVAATTDDLGLPGDSSDSEPEADPNDPNAVTAATVTAAGVTVTATETRDAEWLSELSADGRLAVARAPLTVLHPVQGCAEPYGLARVLRELRPRSVVLYDAELALVRQLEVYKAGQPGRPLRVYFLIFGGSTEEQRYLTALRKEKEAFELLIRERASMVVPEEREGRAEDTNLDLMRGSQDPDATVDTLRAGGQADGGGDRGRSVIVDMREFRSELPALLHRRGLRVDPVTIAVGDYLLTPQLCVERKSVGDLVASLGNGRLYAQCTAMCRRYRRPALLIEFDPGKPFSLQARSGGTMYQEISSTDVCSRLALLTLHFPRLRLLWCASPHAAAQLFCELKVGHAEPTAPAEADGDPNSGDPDPDPDASAFNPGPYDLLLRLPGVTARCCRAVARRAGSLAQLARLSVGELAELLGGEGAARRLHEFVHAPYADVLAAAAAAGGGGGRPVVKRGARGGFGGGGGGRAPQFKK